MIVVGNNIFSRRLSELLGLDLFDDWAGVGKFLFAKKVLLVGLSFSPSAGKYRFIILLAALLFRKKIYGYFIGSDLERHINSRFSRWFYRCLVFRVTILVETEVMKKRAIKHGILVSYVQPYQSISCCNVDRVRPAGCERTVAAYIGMVNQDYYGIDAIIEAADSLRDFKFILIGAVPKKHLIDDLPNVSTTGWLESLECTLNQSSIFVRIPITDGLGHSAIEALYLGCAVIRSTEFPYSKLYSGNLTSDILDIYSSLELNRLPLKEASEYVFENFSEDNIRRKLRDILDI